MNLDQHDNNQLDRELDHLRAQLLMHNTPANVHAAVMKRFAKKHSAGPFSFRFGNVGQWLAPGTALAASVAMSAWMLLSPLAAITPAITNDARLSRGNNAPFFALQSLEQIALEPNPRLIETQIPKMMLANMGMAVSPEMIGESLRAEMLVSAAGQPLALRFTAQ